MGRLLVLLILIAAIVLIWKAYGPKTWKTTPKQNPRPQIKGPDDDPEFLWRLEKEQFKRRREAERRASEERKGDADGKRQQKKQDDEDDSNGPHTK